MALLQSHFWEKCRKLDLPLFQCITSFPLVCAVTFLQTDTDPTCRGACLDPDEPWWAFQQKHVPKCLTKRSSWCSRGEIPFFEGSSHIKDPNQSCVSLSHHPLQQLRVPKVSKLLIGFGLEWQSWSRVERLGSLCDQPWADGWGLVLSPANCSLLGGVHWPQKCDLLCC